MPETGNHGPVVAKFSKLASGMGQDRPHDIVMHKNRMASAAHMHKRILGYKAASLFNHESLYLFHNLTLERLYMHLRVSL